MCRANASALVGGQSLTGRAACYGERSRLRACSAFAGEAADQPRSRPVLCETGPRPAASSQAAVDGDRDVEPRRAATAASTAPASSAVSARKPPHFLEGGHADPALEERAFLPNAGEMPPEARFGPREPSCAPVCGHFFQKMGEMAPDYSAWPPDAQNLHSADRNPHRRVETSNPLLALTVASPRGLRCCATQPCFDEARSPYSLPLSLR